MDILTLKKKYRALLLENGFSESEHIYEPKLKFYKQMTELTAFIVNLCDAEDGLDVIYGYASTAFTRMAGDENALKKWGIDSDGIQLREHILIEDDYDENTAKEWIHAMYEKYKTVEKEELLLLAKEKRKAFLQIFAVRLKPLGFRKKGNRWTKTFGNGYALTFEAQKSLYADTYYFNIAVDRAEKSACGLSPYYERVSPNGESPMDWQLVPWTLVEQFVDELVTKMLPAIMEKPTWHAGFTK